MHADQFASVLLIGMYFFGNLKKKDLPGDYGWMFEQDLYDAI